MTKRVILKDGKTLEILHPRTQVASVEGLEQYVSEHGMSTSERTKLNDLPTAVQIENTYATKTEVQNTYATKQELQQAVGLNGEFYAQ